MALRSYYEEYMAFVCTIRVEYKYGVGSYEQVDTKYFSRPSSHTSLHLLVLTDKATTGTGHALYSVLWCPITNAFQLLLLFCFWPSS